VEATIASARSPDGFISIVQRPATVMPCDDADGLRQDRSVSTREDNSGEKVVNGTDRQKQMCMSISRVGGDTREHSIVMIKSTQGDGAYTNVDFVLHARASTKRRRQKRETLRDQGDRGAFCRGR
jgi:hypothetical protein